MSLQTNVVLMFVLIADGKMTGQMMILLILVLMI